MLGLCSAAACSRHAPQLPSSCSRAGLVQMGLLPAADVAGTSCVVALGLPLDTVHGSLPMHRITQVVSLWLA